MAKVHARNTSVVDRWFDFRYHCLFLLRSDGAILRRGIGSAWRKVSKFRHDNLAGVTLAAYLEQKQRWVTRGCGPVPQLRCQCAVSHNLREWHKAGRPLPCPCPVPIYDTRDPILTREIDHLPASDTIERWVVDSVVEAIDGCSVEPDGHCEHGKPSWLLVLGLI